MTERDPAAPDPSEDAPSEDEARLETLNALHAELEAELERDVDEAGSTGR